LKYYLDDQKKKKPKRSRWTTEDVKTCIPGMPTMVPGNLTHNQEKAYLSKK
jgi:hypothetical protein